jgi:hypothetical protein
MAPVSLRWVLDIWKICASLGSRVEYVNGFKSRVCQCCYTLAVVLYGLCHLLSYPTFHYRYHFIAISILRFLYIYI